MKTKRFFYDQFGRVTSFEVIDGPYDEHIPFGFTRYRRKPNTRDDFYSDSHNDINAELNAMPNYYRDPITGEYFKCDINLDTFKKVNTHTWSSHESKLKNIRFSKIFDVEDAQIIE
jgi:hypothetical protein